MLSSSTTVKTAGKPSSDATESPISALSALKFVASKRQQGTSPTLARRQKFNTKLDEQIQLAKAEQAGTEFAPTRQRAIRDEATGETRKVQVPKKLKPWWWTADNGKTCITLRYGARVVEISEGKNAIETGGIAEVITSLQILKTAVDAGDLDAVLETLSGRDKASADKPAVSDKRATLKLPAKAV